MNRYKITITPGRYEKEYKIILFQQIRILFFSPFYWPMITQNGHGSNIIYYHNRWKTDFGLTEGDIENKSDLIL